MSAETTATSPRAIVWTGRAISVLVTALLTMSGVMKFVQPKELIEGFGKFGYDLRLAAPIGIVELICTLLYLIPQTSILGAILLTGYLGGATATHVRIGDPWFGPVLIGVMVWLGLVLRDEKLRKVLPWRK